ncbi:hypothetical protein BWI93_26375 [Siphonobacter sp. BAB-5385]|uniref:hypothetical protein n=1 Tax=Siphonobacter sp. BAB-5385 TaxID=1864822 RepID=UPI000B9EABF6|nr:hypothetical protein [Siphonobacter sp. BAB-5385]OZI05211.1 hypothetical protein BWI93_26375 [Siphonobacter sp. BAB-5385]
MNIFWLKIAIWLTTLGWPSQIIQRNQAKRMAEEAYRQKKYDQAIQYYEYLERTQLVPDPYIILNMAHAAFAQKDTALALEQYSRLIRVSDAWIASAALNQLGILACSSGDTLRAEEQFQRALERNSENEQARFNYEFVRRRHIDRPDMPTTPPPPNSSSSTPPPQAAEVQASTRKEEILKSLNQVNLSEEQALRLLESSRNQEIQYLQQHPHRAENTVETKEKW